ncbi:ATP-binding cassette domain-containing protein [Bradyrhizobium yuanmingense]|uniref:ATP-binding cassette domain-containing protein n=1 Tax=Bradyrhizobium yuanmingense TaxID=108015 RepID=UPI003CC660F3
MVCGPSGSGKSTLTRTVNRLEEIQSGSVLFEGRDVHGKLLGAALNHVSDEAKPPSQGGSPRAKAQCRSWLNRGWRWRYRIGRKRFRWSKKRSLLCRMAGTSTTARLDHPCVTIREVDDEDQRHVQSLDVYASYDAVGQ